MGGIPPEKSGVKHRELPKHLVLQVA